MFYANVGVNKFLLPGRLRIKIKGLKGNGKYAEQIKGYLSNKKDIYRVDANHYTGNVLVCFNKENMAVGLVEKYIYEIKEESTSKRENVLLSVNRMREIYDYKKRFMEVIISGIVIGGMIVQELFLKRKFFTIKGSIFSLIGLGTIFIAYLFVKDRLKRNRIERKSHWESVFLIGASICIVSGQIMLSLVIMTMAYISKAMKDYMYKKSNKEMINILRSRERKVHKILDDKEVEISYKDIKIGDILILYEQDFLPVDGEVIKGEGELMNPFIKDESNSISIHEGNRIWSGSTIKNGEIHVVVSNVKKTFEYRNMLNYIDNNFNLFGKTDLVNEYYDKIIPYTFLGMIIYYIITADLWLLLTTILFLYPNSSYMPNYMTVKASVINAYAKDIFITNPYKIKALSKLNKLLINKNILTTDDPMIGDIVRVSINSEDNILTMAASCEKENSYPIGRALHKEMTKRQLDIKRTSKLLYEPGKGTRAIIDGKEVLVGNESWIRDSKIMGNKYETKGKMLRHLGQIPIYIAYNHRIIGLIGIQETLKDNTLGAIEKIRELGIDIRILSFNGEEYIENIAQELGIESYMGNMPRENGNEKVKKLEEDNAIGVVGDGIDDFHMQSNDPVRIGMVDKNSYPPSDYLDLIIMDSNIMSLPSTIIRSKYTMEKVYQNDILSVGFNVIGILLALTNSINFIFASLYRNMTNFIVFLNGMKSFDYKMKYLEGI